jgi:hypothetical protein
MLMAVVALGVITALGLALISTSGTELSNADSFRNMDSAHVCAEDGTMFLRDQCLPDVRLPYTVDSSNALTSLKTALLATDENGQYVNDLMKNLVSQGVTPDLTISNGQLIVPAFQMPNGSYQCYFEYAGLDSENNPNYWLYAKGTTDDTQRMVAMRFPAKPYVSPVFSYGLASKGVIRIGGNAQITGDPDELASVLSTADQSGAIDVSGSATVEGDLYATSTNSLAISYSGSATIAGQTTDSGKAEHVHTGVADPEFPVIDTTCFLDVWNNASSSDKMVIASQDDIDATTSYNNLKILKGASTSNQPLKFSSDTVINGVMYVEYPNWIKFSGSVTINGVIVSDNTYDASTDADIGEIDFVGSVTMNDPSALPNETRWDELKELDGTSMLVPGFDINMKGNSATFTGMIAANTVNMSGNSGGGERSLSMPGPVMGLGERAIVIDEELVTNDDSESTFWGSSTLSLKYRDDQSDVPPGFLTTRYFDTETCVWRDYMP